MRYRWENSIPIPDLGFATGSSKTGTESSSSSTATMPHPNLGSCLLHQKLQMLNCCIERKIKRESAGYGHEGTVLHEASSGAELEQSPLQLVVPNNDVGQEKNRAERVASIESSSDDEFFECIENDANEEGQLVSSDDDEKQLSAASSSKRAKKSLTSEKSLDSSMSEASFKDSLPPKPEGRLAQIKNMFSLATGEPLFIPVTQEPSPVTEDMLEEHAEVLAKLGTTAEGSKLRARMQSACLLSDMESFKAANPGCILEDFVRWYSPRDYIEAEEEEEGMASRDETENEVENITDTSTEKPSSGAEAASSKVSPFATSLPGQYKRRGQLSQRMQIPGNMWVEVWQSARHVPARRQKRLFDDTKEAEKVLHFLSSLRPSEVTFHLLPMLIHASIMKLAEREDLDVPVLKQFTDQVISKAAKVMRLPHHPDLKRYEDVIHMIELAETVSSRAQSLKSKFTRDLLEHGKAEEELHLFVASLLQQPEVIVRGGSCGPAGSAIHKLFVAAQKAAYMIPEEKDDANDPSSWIPSSDIASRPASTVPDFPSPWAREYILRAMVPRPAPYSRVLPQRMYCVLVDGDYRMAGAFSSDTTFQ